MALWAAVPCLLLLLSATRHPHRWTAGLFAAVFAIALLTVVLSPAELPAARAAAATRAYWFPARWRWFEWVGALAPCLLSLCAKRDTGHHHQSVFAQLARALVLTTMLCVTLALLFAQQDATSLTVARLQPMRGLHLVFLAFLAAGAARLQQQLRNRRDRLIAGLACAALASGTFAMQRSLFSSSPHLELFPAPRAGDGWSQAFAWCRTHTPRNALFALDADYIDDPGEDAIGFRSTSQRSSLPDRVKDAGVAAVLPELAPAWLSAIETTRGLDTVSDAERVRRLQDTGVTWLVLSGRSQTAFPCPYRSRAAQVCRLPDPPHPH